MIQKEPTAIVMFALGSLFFGDLRGDQEPLGLYFLFLGPLKLQVNPSQTLYSLKTGMVLRKISGTAALGAILASRPSPCILRLYYR